MRVHHIEFLCKDLKLQVQRFCLLYGFRVYGRWRDVILQQKEKVVLKKDRIYFVLHEDAKAECDYVDNIALEARKLSELCELIPKENILVKPAPVDCTISSQFEKQSSIKGAVIRSPVGRVKHTLVDKSNYRGLFLPNFTLHQYSEEDNLFQENKSCEIIDGLFSLSHEVVDLKSCSNDTLMLDHITFAVNSGTSFDLIKWYTDFLHMERCKVNNNEQADGFKVETLNSDGKQLGLRLTAMQYHFCSEISMKITSPGGNGIENPKIVFAESLLGQGKMLKYLTCLVFMQSLLILFILHRGSRYAKHSEGLSMDFAKFYCFIEIKPPKWSLKCNKYYLIRGLYSSNPLCLELCSYHY